MESEKEIYIETESERDREGRREKEREKDRKRDREVNRDMQEEIWLEVKQYSIHIYDSSLLFISMTHLSSSYL